MNEKKKMVILLLVILFIILLVVFGTVFENNKSKKYMNQFYSDFNSSEYKLVLIGRGGCSWCQLFQPILDIYSEHYEFSYTYVDTDELTNSVFNKLLKDINVSSEDFGTPLTLVVKEGSVLDSISGYVDEEQLLEFLKKYDFVSENGKLFMNYIDYEDYEKLIKSDKTEIIVFGQTSCSYCIKAKPVLNKVIKDNDVKINYLNITELGDEDKENFGTSLDYFESNDWGTPLTLIVKKGKVIDSANGLLDYDGYVELFSKNGIIK